MSDEKDAVVPMGKNVVNSLLHLKCKCGNELYIDYRPEGWTVNFESVVHFHCPCGEVISVGIKRADIADKIIKVLKDNYWEGGCGEIHLKSEIERVLGNEQTVKGD